MPTNSTTVDPQIVADHQTTEQYIDANHLVTSINVSASLTIKIKDNYSTIEFSTNVLHPSNVDLDSLIDAANNMMRTNVRYATEVTVCKATGKPEPAKPYLGMAPVRTVASAAAINTKIENNFTPHPEQPVGEPTNPNEPSVHVPPSEDTPPTSETIVRQKPASEPPQVSAKMNVPTAPTKTYETDPSIPLVLDSANTTIEQARRTQSSLGMTFCEMDRLTLEKYLDHMLRIEGAPGFVPTHNHFEQMHACSIILEDLKMTNESHDDEDIPY
jgi:hypothetical protein